VLDILKAIIDAMINAIPGVISSRRSKRINVIGAELFQAYVCLNEILICGDRIVTALENFAAHGAEWQEAGQPVRQIVATTAFRNTVEHQCRNIRNARDLLVGWNYHLTLLEGDAYRDVYRLVQAKASTLGLLQVFTDADVLPLGVGEPATDGPTSALKLLQAFIDRNVLPLGVGEPAADSSITPERRLARAMGEQAWHGTDLLPLGGSWEVAEYEVVARYLAREDPRARLDDLAAALQQMRVAFDENFKVSDILPELGGKRRL
jgi:hypothetical protein